jgi:hypothetical protein
MKSFTAVMSEGDSSPSDDEDKMKAGPRYHSVIIASERDEIIAAQCLEEDFLFDRPPMINHELEAFREVLAEMTRDNDFECTSWQPSICKDMYKRPNQTVHG